jgi:hypothetical protein
MIELCSVCNEPTGNIFCPAGHLADVQGFETAGNVTIGPLYSCSVPSCIHNLNLYHGAGKTKLMLKGALFSKHLGGNCYSKHVPRCPWKPRPQLLQLQVPPRNRRRADRVRVIDAEPVDLDPAALHRTASTIHKTSLAEPELLRSVLGELAPPMEVAAYREAVLRKIGRYGAGWKLCKAVDGADENGIPKASFILATAMVIDELENRHAVN